MNSYHSALTPEVKNTTAWPGWDASGVCRPRECLDGTELSESLSLDSGLHTLVRHLFRTPA